MENLLVDPFGNEGAWEAFFFFSFSFCMTSVEEERRGTFTCMAWDVDNQPEAWQPMIVVGISHAGWRGGEGAGRGGIGRWLGVSGARDTEESGSRERGKERHSGAGRGARGGKAEPSSARKLRYDHLLNSYLSFSLFLLSSCCESVLLCCWACWLLLWHHSFRTSCATTPCNSPLFHPHHPSETPPSHFHHLFHVHGVSCMATQAPPSKAITKFKSLYMIYSIQWTLATWIKSIKD